MRHRLLTVLLVLLVGACSADSLQVVAHNYDPVTETGTPWVGIIWEESETSEVIFLARGTAPTDMQSGTPMGYFVQDEYLLTSNRALTLVHRGTEPDIAMVWTSGVGVDGSHEIDAALEVMFTDSHTFALECMSSDVDLPAVALLDTEGTPVMAWKIINGVFFESVLPVHATCLNTET